MFTLRMHSGEAVKEKNKQRVQEGIFRLGGSLRDISIWLDAYDDIFSDFDPRDYSERNISDDFLHEVKKVTRESDFQVNELRITIPVFGFLILA